MTPEPPLRFRSRSPADTRAAARALAGAMAGEGLVVALEGPLGAGKTVFVKGLAEGLGIEPDRVASPTFVIASEYSGARRLTHVDLYRLASEAELEEAGLRDWLAPGTVVAVEWADRLPGLLPQDRLEVKIARTSSAAERRIEARPHGAGAAAACGRWRERLRAERGMPGETACR